MLLVKLTFVCLVCIVLVLFLFFYNPVLRTVLHKENSTTINILYWTPLFGRRNFTLGLGSTIFQDCEFKNCFTTANKSYLPVEAFDAILFHGAEYTERRYGKPQKRSPRQMYVFANLESPIYTFADLKPFGGFYNWTMTYRSDSDLVRKYGIFQRNRTKYQMPSEEDIQKRPQKIAWFVSRCSSASHREDLVAKIQESYPVDVYGRCGNMSCPRSQQEECYNLLETNYKYYLSFENSICLDYVTEKLFFVLEKNVIPIVYGGGPYDLLAPPNSVINVSPETVQSLIATLNTLDKDPKMYLKYFEWKNDYSVDSDKSRVLCSLCKKLNEERTSNVYEDIDTWWNGGFGKNCIHF